MHPVETQIIPRTSDIGNLEVKRALPSREKRAVGSFVFWDQFGPGELIRDVGLDVRPHPHIGLSTFSYLFAGSMQHRDSLGNDMVIGPGTVNLMTAGSGIVHSERSDSESRANISQLFGIQSWLALPRAMEETAPSFDHYGEANLPQFSDNGIEGRVLLGEWFGLKSLVSFPWDSLYVDLHYLARSASTIFGVDANVTLQHHHTSEFPNVVGPCVLQTRFSPCVRAAVLRDAGGLGYQRRAAQPLAHHDGDHVLHLLVHPLPRAFAVPHRHPRRLL